MPELINKKRTEAKVFLLERLFIDRPDHEFELARAVIHRCCEEIDKQPTIEAEPVRRGRWIQSDALDYKDPNGVIHVHGMCSCCRLIYDFRDMTSRFKFCPNCGADMREVDEDAGTD